MVDAGLRSIHSGIFDARFGPTLSTQSAFEWDNSATFQSFAGDFNGDNQVDFGLRNPANGIFYIRFGPGFGSQITYQWAPG